MESLRMCRELLIIALFLASFTAPATAGGYVLRADLVELALGPGEEDQEIEPATISLELFVIPGGDFGGQQAQDGVLFAVSGRLEIRADGGLQLSPLDLTIQREASRNGSQTLLAVPAGETMLALGNESSERGPAGARTSFSRIYVTLHRPPADDEERTAQLESVKRFRNAETARLIEEHRKRKLEQATDEKVAESLVRLARRHLAHGETEVGKRLLGIVKSQFSHTTAGRDAARQYDEIEAREQEAREELKRNPRSV